MPRLVGLALMATFLAAACVPSSSQEPPPTPTVRATADHPRFELATYMYALQTKGKIRIAVLDGDPPLSSRDAAGVRTGFEPDLGRELARGIFGRQQQPDAVVEWISVDRSTAVSALTSGQADVTIARLSPRGPGALEQPVDYTASYFVTGERILVRSDDTEIREVPDLDTKTVCSTQGTPVAEHVTDANPFARTLELDTYASCLGALRQGQVDAIAADEPTLWRLAKQDAKTRLVDMRVTTVPYAIAVKRSVAADRQGFLPFLEAWLAAAIRDGTWARLYAQDIAPLSGETKTAP
jgi:ABC-type amino acid transport substrate-binding protein